LINLSYTASIQWVSGAVTPGVKWSRHEAGYAPPSTAKVKNVWSYTSNVSVAWCLVKHRDNFTFTFASIEILWISFSIPALLRKLCPLQHPMEVVAGV